MTNGRLVIDSDGTYWVAPMRDKFAWRDMVASLEYMFKTGDWLVDTVSAPYHAKDLLSTGTFGLGAGSGQ
jgi:hypothetical protein